MPPEPYRDTSVSVVRSKEQIAKTLRQAGARGVEMQEEWEGDRTTLLLVRFMWPTEQGAMLRVRFQASPLPPERGSRTAWKISPEQRERQAWRGLAWYIESLVKAAAFGIVPFEAVFLAYFENDRGVTIGDQLIPQIEQGVLALPRGSS
jgi:hypothetical protein